MKNVKMFGKSIPLIAIILVAMLTVGASAYLADYLSNTVTADFTVKSPMLVGVSLGESNWGGDFYPAGAHDLEDWKIGTGTLGVTSDIYGGGTLTIYLMSQNLADGEVKGFEEIIVYNPEGITATDFDSVMVRVDSIHGDLGYGEEQDMVSAIDEGDDVNTIAFVTPVSTWGEGETDVTEIVVTFHPAASGTYTFSYRITPEAP